MTLVDRNDFSPAVYEIRVKGHLDTRWEEWFENLTITHCSDGNTLLSGPIEDQTVLHSVLLKIRNMNLKLISVNQVKRDGTG